MMDQRKQYSQAGFTLIETSISMILMAIVGLGVATLFAYAARSTSSAADREMATAVAQQRMEQLRNVSFLDSALNATSVNGVVTSVTRLGRVYSVRTTITDSLVVNSLPTMKTITIKVTPLAAGEKWSTAVSTMFGSVTLVSKRTALQVGPNRSL
jgi:prepilin-type N-terminal cleavage/methylation domain-containing protein